MSSIGNELAEYRLKQKEKYYKLKKLEKFYETYKNKIDLNPISRSASRIVNYSKRHFFHKLINLSDDQLQHIPGKYLLRIKVKYDKYLGSYIGLDLRIYGKNPYQEVYINDAVYYLTEIDIKKVLTRWEFVEPTSNSGTKFQRTLDYSRVLCDAYKKTTNQFPSQHLETMSS